MKLLIVLLAGLLLAWLWRSGRTSSPKSRLNDPEARPPKPDDIVSCRHCGLHVPKNEAVMGRTGTYCGAAHRELSES